MAKIINSDGTVVQGTHIKIGDGMRPYRLVLRNEKVGYQPFVTHMESMVTKDNGETWEHESYFWGHYFAKEEDAIKDFEERRKTF